MRSLLLGIGLTCLAACGADTDQPARGADTPPDMRWDFHPEGDVWTDTALTSIASHGSALPQIVPADIETWCPGYPEASDTERAAFWTGLLSALSKHESTWNPRAVGGGGRWFGLVQISPATARGYGCEARSGEALLDGSANLSCAIRIWATTVPRDGVVAAGGGGVAADWGPFSSASKRADMSAWTQAQSYCSAG